MLIGLLIVSGTLSLNYQHVYGNSNSTTVGYEAIISSSSESGNSNKPQQNYREEEKETQSPDIVSKGNLPDLGSEGKLDVMILGIVVSLFGMYFYLRRREND